MLRIAHEKHNPQMTQMAADTQKPDEPTKSSCPQIK
jgi:hypothetical protein